MDSTKQSSDALLKFAEQLRELEVVIGSRAGAAVAEVRARLVEAAAKKQNGDLQGAVAVIRQAMQRLASLGSDLDPAEGQMMKFLAERFAEALGAGDRGAAKEAVNIMRHKAGDPEDEPNSDW